MQIFLKDPQLSPETYGLDSFILNKECKKKNNVVKNGEKTYFVIEDEGEIFDIADEYLEAVENNSLEKYWKDFQ